jgi:hypothetical protein
MSIRPAVVAPLLALCALISLASCQGGIRRAELHHVVHERSLASFATWWTEARAAGSTRWDLTTDGCSASPDRGPTFDFRWPCTRHDLAWRNVRRLVPPASAAEATALRRSANQRFRADLLTTCAVRPTWQRATCRALAEVYHGAVQLVA